MLIHALPFGQATLLSLHFQFRRSPASPRTNIAHLLRIQGTFTPIHPGRLGHPPQLSLLSSVAGGSSIYSPDSRPRYRPDRWPPLFLQTHSFVVEDSHAGPEFARNQARIHNEGHYRDLLHAPIPVRLPSIP